VLTESIFKVFSAGTLWARLKYKNVQKMDSMLSSSPRRGYARAYQFIAKHKTDFERVCAEEDRQMQEKG
jgi:hypothetical protein